MPLTLKERLQQRLAANAGGPPDTPDTPDTPDVQANLWKLTQITDKARSWVEKSVTYSEQGKHQQARDAANKARFWLARARMIEQLYKKRGPHE